jgi:osmotically-inducible protein OsmY
MVNGCGRALNCVIIPHFCSHLFTGVVTLHGVVERAYQRTYAEAIVRQVSGVIGVKNKIFVRPAQEIH